MNINLTLIGQSITFVFFVLFCMKYVWPALLSVMQQREERIAQGLTAATKASKDLELAQQQAAESLDAAKKQAAEIIEQANKRASQVLEEAKEQAVSEAERIKSAAEADVQRQVSQAKEELRKKVAVLAVTGAEKILGQSVDAKAHDRMLDNLAADL